MLRLLCWTSMSNREDARLGWHAAASAWLQQHGIRLIFRGAADAVLVRNDAPPVDLGLPCIVEDTLDGLSWQTAARQYALTHARALFMPVVFRYPQLYNRPTRFDNHLAAVLTGQSESPVWIDWEQQQKIQLALPATWQVTPWVRRQFAWPPALLARPCDVLFAGREQKELPGWLRLHRHQAKQVVAKMGCKRAWQPSELCTPYEQLTSLLQTKMFLSPWGSRGFRGMDFAALVAGCVVIKPECSGIQTFPDIYDPRRGWVAYCNPDFSDLEAVVQRVIADAESWQLRVREARQCILDSLEAPALQRWVDHVRAALPEFS